MVATAVKNDNAIVYGGGTCTRYFGSPHKKIRGDNSGNIQFAVPGLPQHLIDVVIHSVIESPHDFRHFAKEPLDDTLADEENIDRILDICEQHWSEKRSWEPDCDAVERLVHVLVPLCRRYAFRTREVVDALTALVDLSAKNWYYRMRSLLAVIRSLEYCPDSFLGTLEQLSVHDDFAIGMAARHTLEKLGDAGREVLERLRGTETPLYQQAIFLHASSDPYFADEDLQDIVARKSKFARWDSSQYVCRRDCQFVMAKHGVHAWRHLLPSFEYSEEPERPHEVAGIPYMLAIIGNLPQLIELYPTSPQRKIAILQAISITAAKYKFKFDKNCEKCDTFVPPTDLSNLFPWTLLMIRDPSNEVAQQAAMTLDLLLVHPSLTEEHKKAALTRVQDGRKMADPNLQASRAVLVGTLLPSVEREAIRNCLHTVLRSVIYSLALRYHIALAIKGVENPFAHKLDCNQKNEYPTHYRPKSLETALTTLAEAYGNRTLNDFESTLYQDLLAMHLDTTERERKALEIVHGS